MFPKKVRTVLAALGRSQSDEMRQPPPKIIIIFTVAIAIRKFQKFESNKYKKALSYNFNKQAALDELRHLYAADKEFFVKEFVKLAYFTRKFNLTFEDLNSLDKDFQVPQKIFEHLKHCLSSTEVADERMLNFLCLTLKYLTRNSANETSLELSSIAQMIETCGLPLIKKELVSLLVCSFEKLKSFNLNPELEKLLLNLPEIDEDAKAILSKLIKSNKAVEKSKADHGHARPTMEIRQMKKNQQIVSKTIQTVKSKQERKNSEETDFTFLNLSDCMKNRNKNRNIAFEPLGEVENQSGSDRSNWRTTWGEAIALFELVFNDQILKDDDKDTYLPKRFLGYHYFTGTLWDDNAGRMYSFFINRMFASIFRKISAKQQLNEKSIDKLLKCITDFENLVSVLNLKVDFVNFFIDAISNRYEELKNITSPGLVSKFVEGIKDKTMEKYLVSGWFYGHSEKFRKKSNIPKDDYTEAEKIIAAEINEVRLDAVKALYNCARRKKETILTTKAVKIIRDYAKISDEGEHADQTFTNYIFELLELAGTLKDFNYAEVFEIYLNRLNPGSAENVDAILRFMLNQARDMDRSKELFKDHVMEILIKLVGQKSRFSRKQKLDVLGVINAYLQHEENASLNEKNLYKLMSHCFKSNDMSLIFSGLTALLLSTDKTQSFSQDILLMLHTNYVALSHNEECTSFIIFILSRVFCANKTSKRLFLDDTGFIESVSNKIVCTHIIEFDDEDSEWIKFSQPSEKKSYSSSNGISLLSAKIISRSVGNKVILNPATIDNLLLILQSNNEDDKQTKIVASKCLYSLTKYMSLESDVLNQLLDLMNSPIYDVSVYLQVAYIRECVKVAQTTNCLDSIHLENISALYVIDSLNLGQGNFEEEINKNLFQTLLYEARKQKFKDKNIFLLFDSILNSNGKYASQVLNILVAYSNRFKVPEATVRTLESLLNVSSYFEKSLLVLQNVIFSGQASVTRKTLTVFIDYLYLPFNSRLRFYSFKILQQASQNQELPQDIFFKFELVRAAFALECHAVDKHMIIEFIEALTDAGIQLPADTSVSLKREISDFLKLKALSNKKLKLSADIKLPAKEEICDTTVLKIFKNVSRNKQIIEQDLLHYMIKLFNPTADDENNIILIKIFENAAKNNQTLPANLLKNLELALGQKKLERSALPVFIYLAQKGEKLSPLVNNKLLDRLSSELDPILKQELLSSLGSLIDANKTDLNDYMPKLNRILADEITSNNFNVQKLCIPSIHKLVTVSKQISNKLLERLIQIGTDVNCNEFIRNEIETLFDSIEDNYNPLISQRHYREKIKLANLYHKSSEETLAYLNLYANLDDEFLPQNYKQLKDIIDNGSTKLQEDALGMLNNYRHKCKIMDELLESVAILFESTMSENIKNSCLLLLNDTVRNGKTLAGRAGEIWEIQLNRDEHLKKFFQSEFVTRIKHDFQLTDQIILDLLGLIQATKKISAVKTLTDFIQLIVNEKSDNFQNQSFVLLIEQCLIKKSALEIALSCYCRIIKEEKTHKVEECLQALVEHFCEKMQDMTDLQQPRLFESMLHASKFTQLPDVCMEVVVNNLDNSNEVIRGYAFATLRISKDETFKKIFNCWCDMMLKSLSQNVNLVVEKSGDYLDLLEIVASVKFFDVTVLKNKGRKIWKRELLTSNIFQCFNVFQVDQIQFYTGWLEVEKKFQYHESCKILSLIQSSKFDSFSQIVQLTSMILELDFDDVSRMLTIYGPEPYKAFRQDWCTRKMQTCMSDAISSKYCTKLAEKLCSSFDISFIGKLFCCLKSIDNLSTFENLLDFCSREKIHLDDMMNLEKVQLNDLKVLIEAKHLCKSSQSQPESEIEEKAFLHVYENLNKTGWNFFKLFELVTAFNPKAPFNRFKNLLNILNTIQVYNLSSSSYFATCKQILTDSESFQEMIRKLNKVAIENHFQLEGKVLDLNELLAELKKHNKSDEALMDFIENGSLDIKKHIFQEQSEKANWYESRILDWVKRIKSQKEEFSDYEAIAVILRANYLVTGHTLTDIQILCCLIALRSDGGNLKSKLLQVATGEGKSTIICILAIINALRGKQVDVVTSSPVLAERDAKQKSKLYRMFGLTCSDNNDKTVYLKGRKDCYLADVVYGEMSQFQFDILRDNYSKLGTLGDRKFHIAIVDEVDSMLIDDSSKIARLSSTVPGMDHFQPVYVLIWQSLLSIKERFIMFKGKMYFVYGKVGFEKGKIILEIADHNNDIVKIPDLEDYLLNSKDISHVGEIVDDIDVYLRRYLESYLDLQIKQKRIYIPSNFTEFLEKQKPKWIANAVEALNYQENVHYIVQGGEIKPVDYYSTGIVQSSTNWSDGLHQFLQLKHNLKMKSETLTTNFLSNTGYMKKYKQVYGLTGTLGSETARNVLKDVYKVDLINIPQRRLKQYLELKSVVANCETDWLREITSNIKLEIEKGRGILVICETIEHANRISEILKKKLRSSAVKLYTMNDMDQEKNVEKILPGEVIIATNLAGRGTDIQTDEIESSGGLHVILTFMPSNQRVEDQAFGRTARQGKRGTGLMILNANNLPGNASTTEGIKKERDERESSQLEEFKKNELRLIQVKDSLFNTFCSFLNDELRVQIRMVQNPISSCAKQIVNSLTVLANEVSNSSCAKQVVNSLTEFSPNELSNRSYFANATHIINWFTDIQPTTYECSVLAAVEEQWAGFLSKLDEGTIKCEDAERECEELISQLRRDFESNSIIKNPYYNISIANDMLVNRTSEVEQALEYFKKAIALEEKAENKKKKVQKKSEADELDPESGKSCEKESENDKEQEAVYGAGAAHLGVAWCHILLKNEGYKDCALSSFKTALKCLSNEMSVLNATQLLLEQRQVEFVNSDLYKQLNVKATILGSYLSGINSCIDAINKSKRLIDVVAVKKHKKKDGILETIKHFTDQERNDKGKSPFKNENLKLSSDESYSLTFNHLTTSEDSGTKDQALITLEKAFDEKLLNKKIFGSDLCSLNKSYSDIRINMKQVDLAKIKSSLFNPNKEFKDLTRESALSKLKEEQSYGHWIGFSSSFEAYLTVSSNDGRNLNEVYKPKKLQINDLIKFVEKQEDDALRFDIVIEKANENDINKVFKTRSDCEKSIKLNVDFDNLNHETAAAKLLSIKAESFDFEFVLNKENLLKLIESDPTLMSCKLYDSEKQLFEKVDRQKLLERAKQLKSEKSPCFIRFEQLTLDQANNIVKECNKNAVFAISFIEVHDFYDSQLNDGQVNFSFDKLNHDTSQSVINVLRKQNFEFSLQFLNLNDKQVRFVLKYADLAQEDMEIRKVKNVSELFMKVSFPTHELNEFASKGIEHILEISERLFVPWRSVVAVAALGIGQVVIGGALIATGFAASVGMGLVTEGLSDVFAAYRAYNSRQFLWSDYCKQKAISIALSAISMGWSKLKNAGKGIQTVTTGVSTELLEQAGTQLISNRQVVGQTLIKNGSNLKSLAYKFVTVKAGEAVARECLNTGIKALSNLSFELLKPKISESVQSRVRASFCNPELMRLLRKMHAIDSVTNSRKLQSMIEQIVSETINPRNDFMRTQWESIGLPLIKGVLSDSTMYGNAASMAFRISATLNGLYAVTTLTNKVASNLVAKLKSADKNSTTISLIFHRTLYIKRDNAKAITNIFKDFQIFDDSDNFQVSQSDLNNDFRKLKEKINDFSDNWEASYEVILKKFNLKEDLSKEDVLKCLNFVRDFYEKFVEIDLNSFSMIMKIVSDQIADQLIRIMDSQLVQPWSTLAVSKATASISERIQDYYLVSEEQNSDSQNADQKKYDELFEKNKEDLTPEEINFMANYGKFRTFAQQINYNNRDYCIAYSQCEMAYYAGKLGSGGDVLSDVKNIANSVREGKPVNIAVMIATAKENGVNIKVVDDANYIKTQEDIDNGVEVIYFERGVNNEVGHTYYIDNNGHFVEAGGAGNNCFFACFSTILQNRGILKSVDDLRKETAKRIEKNSKNFTKVLSAANWIRSTHPDSSNNLLFTAGLYRDANGKLKVQPEDVADLYKNINPRSGVKQRKNSRGGVIGDIMKEAVEKASDLDGNKDKNEDAALHHIIPNDLIEDAVTYSITTDPKFTEQLEDFINKPEVIQFINQRFNIIPRNQNQIQQTVPATPQLDPETGKKIFQVNPSEHGQLLHAAISWYQNNLVRGPLPELRANDSRGGVDQELLHLQSHNFQNAVANFLNNNQTFRDFLNLPPCTQADWEKQNDGTYVAKAKKV